MKYLLEVSIIMGIMYIPYLLVFRKYTFFQMNRIYLIGSIWLAFIIPTLKISFGINSNEMVRIIMEPVMISSNTSAINEVLGLNSTQIFQIIYIAGTFILSGLLSLRIFQLFRVIRRHGYQREGQLKIVAVNGNFTPASFFNYVFISAEEKNREIHDHELVHVKQGHSYDVIFIELVKLFMWFNPFIWMYASAIRNVHEYLADDKTLQKGYDRNNYQHLIFENTFGVRLNNLMVNFNYSPLKKRLKMMTKNKSKNNNKWNYILVMPVLVISFFLFGMNYTFAQEKKPTTESQNTPQKTEKNNKKSKVYMTVEEMPIFNGAKDSENGIEEFKKYIGMNLKYPKEAEKKGIQGKVFVQFEINTKGKVQNVIVARGVDPLLDAEAVRVIQSSPEWIPGTQKGKKVNVQYTFPIAFALKQK